MLSTLGRAILVSLCTNSCDSVHHLRVINQEILIISIPRTHHKATRFSSSTYSYNNSNIELGEIFALVKHTCRRVLSMLMSNGDKTLCPFGPSLAACSRRSGKTPH